MINEFTNISSTGHFVILTTIIEDGLPKTIFFSLVQLDGGKKTLCFNFLLHDISIAFVKFRIMQVCGLR